MLPRSICRSMRIRSRVRYCPYRSDGSSECHSPFSLWLERHAPESRLSGSARGPPVFIVITGFRTIEELETIKAQFPDAQVLVIEATERARYQRYLARGRLEPAHSRRDFRISDENQWSFGLLRVAEDFADLRIINEGSLPDFLQQIGAVLGQEGKIRVSGISRRVRPRHGLRENQLYRCLVALHDAGRALSCNEIQKETGRTGAAVRFNNVNKVLKKVPELANRYALSGSRLRYDITNAGRAYVRYMQARDGS